MLQYSGLLNKLFAQNAKPVQVIFSYEIPSDQQLRIQVKLVSLKEFQQEPVFDISIQETKGDNDNGILVNKRVTRETTHKIMNGGDVVTFLDLDASDKEFCATFQFSGLYSFDPLKLMCNLETQT